MAFWCVTLPVVNKLTTLLFSLFSRFPICSGRFLRFSSLINEIDDADDLISVRPLGVTKKQQYINKLCQFANLYKFARFTHELLISLCRHPQRTHKRYSTTIMSSLKINTDSYPVELTTTEGYEEFIKSPLCNEHSTVFPDNDATGYVLVNDEVVATVSGEAKDHLFLHSCGNIPVFGEELKAPLA